LENFRKLKNELLEKGHTIKSETDSELIAHLIEDHLKTKPRFLDAFSEALKRLEGSYAILAIKADENVILGAKRSFIFMITISLRLLQLSLTSFPKEQKSLGSSTRLSGILNMPKRESSIISCSRRLWSKRRLSKEQYDKTRQS